MWFAPKLQQRSSRCEKREDTGDLVKLAGALAIFAVTFTTVAAFFNLGH